MQASAWNPPSGTLGGILREAEARVRALEARRDELEHAAAGAPSSPSFAAAIERSDVAVIAEVKRRSPSRGWIRRDLDAAEQALRYEAGGAAAVSVLTEPAHFAGTVDDLVEVRGAVRLPTIKKDFHIAPIQLLEAKAVGAAAALLIARALAPERLVEMMRTAEMLALETVVEVRDDAELARALDVGARIIGVNNRDLETLAIDATTSERMLMRLPPNVIGIAESGVRERADVERFARAGAHAVLVGSSVSSADEPEAAVRALAGVPRVARGR